MIQRRELARLRAMVFMQSKIFMTCHPPLKGTESEEFMAAMGNMATHAIKASATIKNARMEPWSPLTKAYMEDHPNCRCMSDPIRFTMDPDPPKTLLARLADCLARFIRGSSATIGRSRNGTRGSRRSSKTGRSSKPERGGCHG